MKYFAAAAILLFGTSCEKKASDEAALTIPESEIWWNDAVFYEIFVRSFYDSDNNGIGDFKGLTSMLDYLNDGDPDTDTDLGITAIWLMPVFDAASYHGYDIIDYRQVEPDYGTKSDFAEFLDEAHERGIRVIVDFVINHTSDQNPWFLNSAEGPDADKRSWYIWTTSDPGYLGPWGQPVWHERNGAFFYGVFWEHMPDLNFRSKEVTDQVKDIARYWYDDVGVDGLRVDAAPLLIETGALLVHTKETLDWWHAFYAFQKNLDPAFMTVGEVWNMTAEIAPYTNERFDYCFEFDLASRIIDAVNTGNALSLASKIQEVIAAYPPLQYGTFLTNHDQDRVIETLGQDLDKAKLAASILLTLPGVPYLYYGEEVGMRGAKPDEFIRRPMQWSAANNAGFTAGTPWIAVNPDYASRNVLTMRADSSSLWNHYRKFISLRAKSMALRHGDYEPISTASPSLLAFLRISGDEAAMVAHNLAGTPVEGLTLKMDHSQLQQGSYLVTMSFHEDDAVSLAVDPAGGFQNTPVNLAAHSTIVLNLQRQ